MSVLSHLDSLGLATRCALITATVPNETLKAFANLTRDTVSSAFRMVHHDDPIVHVPLLDMGFHHNPQVGLAFSAGD